MLKLERDTEQVARSSGSIIEPDVRIGLTLRILAGGSYMDAMMLFSIGVSTILEIR